MIEYDPFFMKIVEGLRDGDTSPISVFADHLDEHHHPAAHVIRRDAEQRDNRKSTYPDRVEGLGVFSLPTGGSMGFMRDKAATDDHPQPFIAYAHFGTFRPNNMEFRARLSPEDLVHVASNLTKQNYGDPSELIEYANSLIKKKSTAAEKPKKLSRQDEFHQFLRKNAGS